MASSDIREPAVWSRSLKFRNYFLAALPAEDLVALAPHMHEVALSPNQTLHEPGSVIQNVYFPSSAVISVVTSMADGRVVESQTVGFESVIALSSATADEPAQSRAFVQLGGGAIRLPSARLREQVEKSPALMRLVLRHLDSTVAQVQQGVACNALHDAVARLARWLLVTRDRTDSDVLPLTQEYLAIMVGVQRTTVTAAAMELKQSGVIKYQRGVITILDRDGLEARACECYGVIKARTGALLA